MLDQIRSQIQSRVDELTDEMNQLRRALLALDSEAPGTPKARAGGSAPAPRTEARSPVPKPASTSRAKPAARSSRRTAPGATKTAVLEALSSGEAMTASEVAAKAGLGRATVSTTLSKLASSGEVQKAERGYRTASRAKAAA